MTVSRRLPLQLRTSPHLRSLLTIRIIMRNVVYALLPVCAFAVYNFGISALTLILVTTAVSVGTEHLFCRIARQSSTVGDWSVVITGVLLALVLPPAFPLWMAAAAAVFAVGIGKLFFGGLGYNVMNPALVGRAFAQATFTAAMTTWTPPLAPGRFSQFIPSTLTLPFLIPRPIDQWLSRVAVDGFTGATPLAARMSGGGATGTLQLLTGTIPGCTGETAALLILLCGLYLIARRIMNWRITAGILLSASALSGILHLVNPHLYPDPLFTLLAGGLMLGAVFMATDMVNSPETRLGAWVYGGFIGSLVVVIRFFGSAPEGVMYAILLGNAASPLIARITQPRGFGRHAKKRPPAGTPVP